MNPKDVVVWITIGTAIAGSTARFIAVEERQDNQRVVIEQLKQDLRDVRGYLTAAEQRVSVLERDRELLERVHAIEVRLSAIEARRERR